MGVRAQYDGSASWCSTSRMKVKHSIYLRENKYWQYVAKTNTHTVPAADDSLGKAVHVGTAGRRVKQSRFTMRKRKCLQGKYTKEKSKHTVTHVEHL